MSELIGIAKAVLVGVTQGKWTVPAEDDPAETSATVLVERGPRSILHCCDGFHFGYASKADAQFIATARTLVPELADALHAAYVEIANLHEQIGALEASR